jgi:diguanylate cyclase (GGDEF)-like protein/PAS domain S-box-containing protein
VIGNLSPIIVEGMVTGILGSARDMTEQREVETELQRGAERFRSLFERSSHAIGAIDTTGVITQVNVALEQITGYRPEELLGKSSLMLIPAAGRDRAQHRINSLAEHSNSTYEGVIITKSGQEIAVEVDVSPIRVHDTLEGYYFRFKDLTRDHAIQRAITQKDERMRLLYRVAAATQSSEAQIVEALVLGSQAMGMRYGFIAKFDGGTFEIVHRHGPEGLFAVGFRKPLTQSIGMRLRDSARAMAMDDLRAEPYSSELSQANIPWKSYIGSRITVDGETYGALLFADTNVRSLTFDDADLDFIDLMASIVGGALARSERDRDLQRQAFYDVLTGAVNRRLLEEHVAKAIARCRRLSHSLALHYVDLNRFKPINDQYGHDAGDEVLCEVVRRLIGVVRDHDVVARLGGDEFVVMQADIANDEAIRVVASRLHDAFIAPMHLTTGVEVRVGCSIGTATYPRDGATLAELLKNADTAMYAEKRRSNPPARPA